MPMDAHVIMGIPICTRNTADFWCWHFEKSGNFTVLSAYNMLVATRQRREAWLEGSPRPSSYTKESSTWKRMWKTQVPGKISMFLWRLSKQSLPTNDVRAHRHTADSSACGFCGAENSWKHSFIDCTMSRCTWAMADEELAQAIAMIMEPNAKQWLFTHIEALPHEWFVKLSVRYGLRDGRLFMKGSFRARMQYAVLSIAIFRN